MSREILDFLKMNDVEYKEELSLAEISPIRIGGKVKIIAYPNSEIKLVKLSAFLQENKIKHKILGRMSNVLPPDEGYNGIIIRTDRLNDICVNGDHAIVGSGIAMPRLARELCKCGLSGFEGLSGIPGSIGGAIVGNAGAFGREISDLIRTVRVFDPNLCEMVSMSPKECGFHYRDSYFKRTGLIILSTEMKMIISDSYTVGKEMKRISDLRRKTQPIDKPSLGSSFKRPSPGVSAARLIDECGLKGYSIGGATVSEKHAGFIINSGTATAKDYIDLSELIKKCVFEKYRINLEREIEIL